VLAGPSLDRVGSRVPLRAGAPSAAHPMDSSRTIAANRKCRLHDVRIGFASVKGLGEQEAQAVVKERELGGEFKSFDEFATRVGLKEEALRNLALVGGFDSFGEPRRALLWRARDAHRTSPSFVRRALSLPTTVAPALPPLGEQERTALDYRITGIPTGPQIMSFYREDLARRGVLRACDLESRRHGSYVLIAGAVVVKQHPETAKGHVFLSLEDETGISNIIIRPATYRRYKRVLDSDAAVVVGGTLQTVDGVISVTAQRLDALTLFAKIAAREWQ
jgi:error-prone DNA polymerase